MFRRAQVNTLGGFALLLMTTLCSAQTQNYVAKFNSNGSTVNSSIFDNGNVGIGTSSPSAKLHVSGGEIRTDAAMITGSSDTCGVGIVLPNGTSSGSQPSAIGGFPTTTSDQWIVGRTGPCWNFANTGLNFIYHSPGNTVFSALSLNSSGNVGIGTTAPAAKLDVGDITGGGTLESALARLGEGGTSGDGTYLGVKGWCTQPSPCNLLSFSLEHHFYGQTNSSINFYRGGGVTGGFLTFATNNNSERMRIDGSGNVGIGKTSPAYALDVNGTVNSTALRFPDATTQTTAWTGVLCGGDYAESVSVSGKRSQYEPGDVIVIDPANPESFLKSSQPYATTVAGIYSTKPGAIGRRATDPDRIKSEIPMAMIGIVPTKVSTENGPIKVGDLLVTSSTLGHAMKGTDRSQLTGAIVGKALEPLSNGNGVINVLVTLQ